MLENGKVIQPWSASHSINWWAHDEKSRSNVHQWLQLDAKSQSKLNRMLGFDGQSKSILIKHLQCPLIGPKWFTKPWLAPTRVYRGSVTNNNPHVSSILGEFHGVGHDCKAHQHLNQTKKLDAKWNVNLNLDHRPRLTPNHNQNSHQLACVIKASKSKAQSSSS